MLERVSKRLVGSVKADYYFLMLLEQYLSELYKKCCLGA